MKMKGSLLSAYGLLLRLYPPDFRERFADEMLDLAAEADPAEWPLIFGDTMIAILRSWLHAIVAGLTPVPAGPDAYLALGESRLTPATLLQGFALTVVLILGLYYVTTLRYSELPDSWDSSDCSAVSTVHTPRR
jgi:hypothetical protein